MSNLATLIETIVSTLTEFGGFCAGHGGKSIGVAAAKKIGWASKDNCYNGPQIAGHSLAGHKMASGYSGRKTKPGESYDPKAEYENRNKAHYDSARLSGTGLGKKDTYSDHFKNENSLRRGNSIYNNTEVKIKKSTGVSSKQGLKQSFHNKSLKF